LLVGSNGKSNSTGYFDGHPARRFKALSPFLLRKAADGGRIPSASAKTTPDKLSKNVLIIAGSFKIAATLIGRMPT
jgi:hypothetical protein